MVSAIAGVTTAVIVGIRGAVRTIRNELEHRIVMLESELALCIRERALFRRDLNLVQTSLIGLLPVDSRMKLLQDLGETLADGVEKEAG